MAREIIQCRFWDRNKKQFIYSGGTPMMLKSFFEHIAVAFVKDEGELSYQTGLLDKNGKEIFEGDIVKGTVRYPNLFIGDTGEDNSVSMVGQVFYDHSGFSLRVVQSMSDPNRWEMVNYFNFVGFNGEVFDDREVIGNVWENPDLTK